MNRFPEVFKSVSGLELATRNKERFDRTPYFLTTPLDPSEKKPSVTDVHIVTPSAQLHSKELLRPQGSNQESRPVQQHLARKKALDIALRAVIEPVLWKAQSDSHSACSRPEGGGTASGNRTEIDISSCLASVIHEHKSCASGEHDLLPSTRFHGCELARQRLKRFEDHGTGEQAHRRYLTLAARIGATGSCRLPVGARHILGDAQEFWPPSPSGVGARRPSGSRGTMGSMLPSCRRDRCLAPICQGQFATTEIVTLSPLPCWEHLSPEQIRARVGAIVQRIEETAAKGREESGSAVLGATAVRAQKPFDQPARPKKSSAPLFHAFTRRVRRELYEAYHLFLAAFRDAADRLRVGDRTARCPLGSFPPALPFAGASG
jgi:hypothetical protein